MPKCTEKPWERQKGESAQAFEAFIAYRDMGSERSLRTVAQKCTKSSSLIRRWSSANDWQERVRAYDNELEKVAREKALKDRKNMISRHIGLALKMQFKAAEALDNLPADQMTVKDIKEYIKIATELERLTRTLEDENSKTESESASSFADEIAEAYQRRKEEDDA